MRGKLEAVFALIAVPLLPGADASVGDLEKGGGGRGRFAFEDSLDREPAMVLLGLRVDETADEGQFCMRYGNAQRLPNTIPESNRLKRFQGIEKGNR